jgi:DNA-binding response OmpR family regulator
MCILLVEDEALIRDLLVDELSFQGFEVCDVGRGDQAVPLIEQSLTPFSLLITDIHMPGRLNGIDVARLLHRRQPSVPVIYMTGRPDALNALSSLGPQEVLLPKPFTLSELLATVRRLLGSGHPHVSRDASAEKR